jgi:hypothetical protein
MVGRGLILTTGLRRSVTVTSLWTNASRPDGPTNSRRRRFGWKLDKGGKADKLQALEGDTFGIRDLATPAQGINRENKFDELKI